MKRAWDRSTRLPRPREGAWRFSWPISPRHLLAGTTPPRPRKLCEEAGETPGGPRGARSGLASLVGPEDLHIVVGPDHNLSLIQTELPPGVIGLQRLLGEAIQPARPHILLKLPIPELSVVFLQPRHELCQLLGRQLADLLFQAL